MSTTGERIQGLRIYNHYTIDELSSQCLIPSEEIIAFEKNQKIPDASQAKDLSSCLGADASYIRGAEKKRYIAYSHITYKLENDQLTETEAWEQAFIDHPYDVYQMTVILSNSEDEEYGIHPGLLLFCDQDDQDGLYIMHTSNQDLIVNKKGDTFYHHQQKVKGQPSYHIALIRPNLEDQLLDITRKIKSGEMDL